MGISLCFAYNWFNPSGSGKGQFHGIPRHRGDVYQLYVKQLSQVVLWGGCHQFEYRRVMVKAQEWRSGNVGAEDDGSYRIALPCMSGGDVG